MQQKSSNLAVMLVLFHVIADADFLFDFSGCNGASVPLHADLQNLQICNICKYRKQVSMTE